ncbi:F6N18.6 [Arabidopsis thaliana]|uniref:F6N18.6 n=1 Tax=Arabidopsis thaliana TaxID=3702 RepID=Q9LPJ6_ARATH|nr:F6N18.6 [Arabidopsis thaliana]
MFVLADSELNIPGLFLVSDFVSGEEEQIRLGKGVHIGGSSYQIWRQRNNVLHNDQRIHPSTLFKMIYREIRNTITGRRSRKLWRPLNASLDPIISFS